MDQTELEAQSQSRKLRRGRHASSYWPPWASRLPSEGTTASDSYWKTGPRQTHSVPHSHEQRRQDYGVTEPVTSCYSASNTYRPKHRALTSVLPKASPQVPTSDQTYQAPQHGLRTARNKLLTTNNVAVVRKTCYKDDVEEDEEAKYDEEDVNYADENAEDEAPEDVDEDQDESYEYNDKDYEEQEADDEVDEVDDESDAFQTQLHRLQHKVQKASIHGTRHLRHAEQQQDLRKIQHQQHIRKMYQDQKLPRYYPQTLEPQQPIAHDTSYGDAGELISDDQHTPPWTPSDPRKSSRRMSETHQAVPSWVPVRKSLERNRERLSSPLGTTQEQVRHQRQHQQQQPQQSQHHQHQQPLRRHRTTKPEIESLLMPQPPNSSLKKCCICGRSTAPANMRISSSGKGNCRLHDYRGFTVRGPPGEDGEAEEQVVCGRCSKRHNMEDLRLGCEASSADTSALLHSSKPHRSRIHHRTASYDCPEDSQIVDEMLAAYASSQPRTSSTLDYSAVAPRGRTRHSVQTARSPLRSASYYER